MIAVGPAAGAALAAVHAACFPAGEAWAEEDFATQLALPGVFGWLDPAGGLVLARVTGEDAEVLTLGVMPAARRRGHGRALLAAALTEAAMRGARVMFLEAAAENAAALGLYAAAGFAVVGRRARYYPGGADAVVMRRELSPARTP